MKVSYKKTIHSTDPTEPTELSEVIDIVRTGVHRYWIDQIREESDKEKKNEIKKYKLPVFFPDVLIHDDKHKLSVSKSHSSTGIIQFDVDDYNLERSKKVIQDINEHPSTVYSFVSPQGGIKFGVMTDFVCDVPSEIKDKHKMAWGLVKEELGDLIGSVDMNTEGIHLTCFLSFDPNAYFNKSPEKIKVNRLVNKKYEERQEERKKREEWKKENPKHTGNTSDDEVLDMLSYIPHTLPYDQRLLINFSLIEHFGNRSQQILSSHWFHKDKKKVEKQIEGQIKSHTSHTGKSRGIGSLVFEAKKNGWKRKPTFKPVEEGIDEEQYLTPEESSKRLVEIIHKDFFEDKKDIMVNVEAGSGKTRTMYSVLSEYLLKNPQVKVAVFLKTHEMMNQFIDDMKENIREYNQGLLEERGFGGMKDSIPFNHHPTPLKGMKTTCKEMGREGSGITEDNYQVIGTTKCDDCYYQNMESCEYFDQYQGVMGKICNVRIYTHNRLFLKPRTDQGWNPDYVVIDEDLVSMITESKETLLKITKFDTEYRSLISILDRVEGEGNLTSIVSDMGSELENDSNKVEKELDDLLVKLNKVDIKEKGGIEEYKDLQSKIKRKKQEQHLFYELLLLSNRTKLQSKYVWLQHRVSDRQTGKKYTGIIYGKKQEILDEYSEVPMLYMDASGNETVIESSFERDFQYERLKVRQQENSKVYQFIGSDSSFSKNSFLKEGVNKIDSLCDWVETLDSKLIGLIRYKGIYGDDTYFNKLDEKINEINGGDKGVISWFGNIRGLNKWKDCDSLVVVGQHRLKDFDTYDLSQLLFREDIDRLDISKRELNKDGSIKEPTYEGYTNQKNIEKTLYMKKGSVRFDQMDYTNEYCWNISEHFDKAETYQAVHRLRLIHGDKNKQLYIVSDKPLEISIDDKLDRYKEFGEKNISVIKYLKENKYLRDRGEDFTEVFGWTQEESRRFRDKRGSGEWMKIHRSLDYWGYKTNDRKVGNVFSWKGCSSEGVRSWLESTCGLDIKSLDKE